MQDKGFRFYDVRTKMTGLGYATPLPIAFSSVSLRMRMEIQDQDPGSVSQLGSLTLRMRIQVTPVARPSLSITRAGGQIFRYSHCTTLHHSSTLCQNTGAPPHNAQHTRRHIAHCKNCKLSTLQKAQCSSMERKEQSKAGARREILTDTSGCLMCHLKPTLSSLLYHCNPPNL